MAANFENFKISPDFPINFRKSHQISKNYLKSSESYGQKPLGGSLKTSPLAWIGLTWVIFFKNPFLACIFLICFGFSFNQGKIFIISSSARPKFSKFIYSPVPLGAHVYLVLLKGPLLKDNWPYFSPLQKTMAKIHSLCNWFTLSDFWKVAI